MPGRIPGMRDDDPLSRAIAPSPDETPTEREQRLRAEQEAKRISDAIDEEISRERQAAKRAPKPVKILLLGQSESGKSTTLKNFQLLASPKAFDSERASWRTVILLNVVRSIRLVLERIEDAPRSPSSSPHSSPTSSPLKTRRTSETTLPAEFRLLKIRLSPLAHVEEALIRKLNPFGTSQHQGIFVDADASLKEVALNSSVWRGIVGRWFNGGDSNTSPRPTDLVDPKDPGALIHACAQDMIQLWNDPAVKDSLARKRLRLEEVSGFFLDSLERVTHPQYIPTNEDILRARIKTLGITEYRFTMQVAGHAISHDWRVFDVGGQRSLVTAWAPFMDDVDAIIFLAPISCFDQVLAEDSNVNRLEDSILLWKSVVSNPLLKTTNIVLFLNKCDILREKLASGVRLSDYVLSYGDRPNDFASASNYLKKKFARILKEFSPAPRGFYSHFTSVTNVKATKHILTDVQDSVIHDSLKKSQLIA